VSLEVLICVGQEFFGSIAALLCGTSHGSYTIPNRIGHRVGSARSLLGRFIDVVSCSFRYGL
jgi:hypothetical protein